MAALPLWGDFSDFHRSQKFEVFAESERIKYETETLARVIERL